MNLISKRATAILISVFAALCASGTVHADLAGDITIDFELGDYYNSPGNLAFAGIPMPGTVGSIDYYLEEGVRHQSIAFSNGDPGSHLHGNLGTGSLGFRSQLAPDSGGGVFVLDDGGAFSLLAWDNLFGQSFDTSIDEDLNVTGYAADDSGPFSVVLDENIYGAPGDPNPDFLALDARFGNVNRIEYWYNATGRGVLGHPFNQVVLLDNVMLGAPVPIPAALPLLLSGLLGIVGFAKKYPQRQV